MSELNKNIAEYSLRIGDTSLILGQRLAEWCGHGPILEEDIALTNVSLDLIGQARAFLTYAGENEGLNRSEDDLAFLREAREYKNRLMAEQPNGDYAQTMIRQFFLSVYQYYFFTELMKSKDATLAALAEKSLKEVTYHGRHSSEWVIRFGDGTEESHVRTLEAIDTLWKYTGDLFETDQVDIDLVKAGIAVDMEAVRENWDKKINEVFEKATLTVPEDSFMIGGSIKGLHSEHLGHLLSEMQVLPRSFPGVEW